MFAMSAEESRLPHGRYVTFQVAEVAEGNYRPSRLPFMRQWIETGEENRP